MKRAFCQISIRCEFDFEGQRWLKIGPNLAMNEKGQRQRFNSSEIIIKRSQL